MLGISNGQPLTKSPFLPDLRPGQYGGQEALRVSAWSVDDVAKWLKVSTLYLLVNLSMYSPMNYSFITYTSTICNG